MAAAIRERAPTSKRWRERRSASADHREPGAMSSARAFLLAGCLLPAATAAAGAECAGGLGTRAVPLPVCATLPNERHSLGLVPLFLRAWRAKARPQAIIAL